MTEIKFYKSLLYEKKEGGGLMPKFRKKPVVVEAEQWFPGKEIAGVVTGESGGLTSILMSHRDIPTNIAQMVCDGLPGKNFGAIHTLEGWHIVTEGDWVITGIKNEKYPCKPDIFEQTYEPVDG